MSNAFRRHIECAFILTRYVLANDLSSTATEAMRRNVEINGLGPQVIPVDAEENSENSKTRTRRAKVVVNEGDAWCAFRAQSIYNKALNLYHAKAHSCTITESPENASTL